MQDAAALSPALEAFDPVAAEALERWATERESAGEPHCDGVSSNFATLDCVDDLGDGARGLARLLRPVAAALLVPFGTLCSGEVVVQLARGEAGTALRRRARGPVPARLGGREFEVRYHSASEIADAMGALVPAEASYRRRSARAASAAEPWISRHPALVCTLEQVDRVLARPLAPLGDHVLYWLVRTEVPCASAGDAPPRVGA